MTWWSQYRNPAPRARPEADSTAFMSKCSATVVSRREGAFVIERHLDIATPDGAMNSFVVHPEEGGPFPVVLFYMDAPGRRRSRCTLT